MNRDDIDDGDSMNRRKFLRNAGLAAGSMAILPGAAAARSNKSADTDPDLSSDQKIRQYAADFRELSESEQVAVYSSISAEQRNALNKAFVPARIEVTTTGSNPSTGAELSADESGPSVGTDRVGGPNPAKGSAKTSGYSTLGSHLWDWYHRVRWNHNGSQVYNVSSNDWANVYDPLWGALLNRGTAAG